MTKTLDELREERAALDREILDRERAERESALPRAETRWEWARRHGGEAIAEAGRLLYPDGASD